MTARSREPSATEQDLSAGQALFRLVRFWSRRWVHRASEELTGEMRHVQHIHVVEAVHGASARSGDATVNAVAEQLGLDHSGASRMVKETVEAGYLTSARSDRDRRRASLALTAEGRALLDGSHRWQRHTFDQLTADWDARDRERFGGYLRRLATQLDLDA